MATSNTHPPPPLYDVALLTRLDVLWNARGGEGHCNHSNGREPQALAQLVCSLPPHARVLEIGFNCGHSAAAMLSARRDVTLVSLDLGEHSYVRAAKAVVDAAFPRRHLLVLGDSTQTLPRLLGDFDMYFVDGCHDYAVAAQDVNNVLARARPTDVFVLDDVLLDDDAKCPLYDALYNQSYEVVREQEETANEAFFRFVDEAALPFWNVGPTRIWRELVASGRVVQRGAVDLADTRQGWGWGNPSTAQ